MDTRLKASGFLQFAAKFGLPHFGKEGVAVLQRPADFRLQKVFQALVLRAVGKGEPGGPEHVVGLPPGQAQPLADRDDMLQLHGRSLAVDDLAVAAGRQAGLADEIRGVPLPIIHVRHDLFAEGQVGDAAMHPLQAPPVLERQFPIFLVHRITPLGSSTVLIDLRY